MKNFFPSWTRKNKGSAVGVQESLVPSESELWEMFKIYISEDDDLKEAFSASGPLGGSVGSRVSRYRKVYDYDVGQNHLSFGQLRRVIDLCWEMYDHDPLIKQGVDTRSLYTFGQGVTIGCRKRGSWGNQISKVLTDFWEDPCNKKQFTSTKALISLDVQSQLEGNVPLFLWQEGFMGMWQVRSLKTSWVEQLIMSGGNLPSSKVVGYVLNSGAGSYFNNTLDSGNVQTYGQSREQRVCYADIDADPSELEGLVGEIPIDYNGRIAYLTTWGRPWAGIGVPSTLPALDPAQRYGGFLEDWSVVQGLFRTFALSVVSKGTNKGVQDVIRRYRENSQSMAQNPALSSSDVDKDSDTPVGHTLLSGMTSSGQAGTRIEAIKTAGATEGPERAREIKLLLCSAFGLPETMFGDAKVGNHATAHTLERTVDLRAQANQTVWSDFIEGILRFVARESAWGLVQNESVDIFVRFPPIVEHKINELVEAITGSYKEGLITDLLATREILQALHVTDSEEILRFMYPDTDGYGSIREAVDMHKGVVDIKKATLQAEAMKENAKMMAARSSSSSSSSGSK